MTSDSPESIPSETYEELMLATMIALSKHGYRDFRVRDIDAEFSKSRQLIYHYFDGVDDLITELLRFLLEYDDHRAIPTDADPLTTLNAEIDHVLLGEGFDEGDFWAVMTPIYEILSQANHNREHQELLNQLSEEYTTRLAGIIEEGIEAGVFAAVDPERFAHMIGNLIDGIHFQKLFLGQEDAHLEGRAMFDEFILPRLLATPGSVDGDR